MTIETRTQLKTYFEAGDRPTQAQFANLIDSAVRDATVALAQGIEADSLTGLINFKSSVSVTSQAMGIYGSRVLAAETTAAVAENIRTQLGLNTITTLTTGASDTVVAVSGGNYEARYLNGNSLVLSAQVTGDLLIALSSSAWTRTPYIQTTSISVATTSNVVLNDIPSWANRIEIGMHGMTYTGGTTDVGLLLGTAGGFTSGGYNGAFIQPGVSTRVYSGQFTVTDAEAASDIVTITLLSDTVGGANLWRMNCASYGTNTAFGVGYINLVNALTRLKLLSIPATDNLVTGTITVSYRLM